MTANKPLPALYWIITATLFVVACGAVVFYCPNEETMGAIQKIFYLHLPVAISSFFVCLTCFIASIGYLSQRQAWWDDLAAAAARIAVQMTAVVLGTGMIWGRSAWGQWWTWSPRLVFSLVLFLLYVVYLMVRASIEGQQRRAVICAVYGVIAFLDVPLVYLSARMMPDIHPSSISLAGPMKITLSLFFVPVVLLATGLVIEQYNANRAARLNRIHREDANGGRAALKLAGGVL